MDRNPIFPMQISIHDFRWIRRVRRQWGRLIKLTFIASCCELDAIAQESSGILKPFADRSVADRLIESAEASLNKRDYVGALKALDQAIRFSPNDARNPA